MTENPDFASLTIKDLRQLAGEHNVANRSRLTKEDLIEAIKKAMSAGSSAASAAMASAAASAPASEPEVIDASNTAFVPESQVPTEEIDEDLDGGDDADDGDGEDDDEGADEPQGIIGAGSQPFDPAQGDPFGEPRRGRRRRRRGRRGGGGRFQDGQFDDRGQPSGGQPLGGQPPGGRPHDPNLPRQPQQHPQGQRPLTAPVLRPSSQPHGPRPDLPRPQRDDFRDGRQEQRQQPQQNNNQQNQTRPPRPRIDGPMRPVPSVLDRLCSFSRGILELCGTDTPAWAQPRLSELLAEAGLVGIPATGVPHPDFHQVVGTIQSSVVPAGHIALIEAPGFALRGDRGDLFPLRKTKVRVAGSSENERAPQSGPEPTGSTPPVGPNSPVVPEVDETDETTEIPAPDEPANRDLSQGGAQAVQPSDARAFERNGDSHRHPHPPVQPQQPKRQPDSRPIHRAMPASVAHALPLVPQDADELAAKPKAEGFRSLGLNDQILSDLATIKYSEPTPIQTEAIPVALSGKDMIGQAQTGTGKTAAFVLPILQKLYSLDGQGPVALVLCPTRELARQVHTEFVRMSGESGARAAIIYGGVSMEDQIDAIARQPHVVIGTPGRIIDHMRRKTLDLSRLAITVLDEADQMLDIGFWPDVLFILSHTPPIRQNLLFSATMPEPIKVMAEKHMKDPVFISIQPKQVTVEQVDQKFIAVNRERKNELLAHFIDTQAPEQLMVFCRTKHQTDRVAEVLKRKNFSAGAIHGDLPQSKRERILQQFRNRELQSLIATNVAARGLDIPTVSHIVNYDIPENPEEYVHRIGRTARNGARGVARTFITPEDGQFLLEIEKHIGLLLEEEKIEGFTPSETAEVKRTIADMPVGGAPRLLKPLVGGIRLGRRHR
jgi:ATP-dependent RNA helicase DeaD